MKRIVLIIVIASLVIISTVGCIKPEASPIYQNNDAGTFTDAASSGKYQAPERWTGSVEKDDLTVVVDADVFVPDAELFPVNVMAEGDEISQQMADRIRTALIGDSVLYKFNSGRYDTKADIQQQIDDIRANINNTGYSGMEFGSAEHEEYKEWLQWKITKLEEMYKDAPETFEITPADTEFQYDEKELLDGEYRNKDIEDLPLRIEGSTTLADGRKVWLKIDKVKNVHAGTVIMYPFLENDTMWQFDIEDSSLDPTRYGVPYADAGITIEQAHEKAISTAREMGLDYLDVSYAEEQTIIERETDGTPTALRPCYKFFLMRNIGGITANYAIARDIRPPEFWMEGYSNLNNCYEVMEIIIAKEGVISLVWGHPTKITATISDNVELLKFEDIQGIFDKQIIMDNIQSEMDMIFETNKIDVLSRRIEINEARLGYMCISRQGYEGEYLMIPVWDFYGAEYLKLRDPDEAMKTGNETNSEGEFVNNYSGKSYLTLNAMDGSVINRALGY